MNELHNYLLVGAILFVLGAIGFLTRRNLIIMILSAEMMLLAVSLNLVAFSRHHGNFEGQAFTVFLIAVAACEAGIALALFVALYQRRHTLDAAEWRELAEEGMAPSGGEAPAETTRAPEFPRLTSAGREPLPEPPSRREGTENEQRIRNREYGMQNESRRGAHRWHFILTSVFPIPHSLSISSDEMKRRAYPGR